MVAVASLFKDKKPLVLIDGSSYLYRAFHALPPLTAANGQPTGAIKGVVAMIKKLIKDVQPIYAAVVFDAKGKTFREEMFPAYKANRPPMPEELRAQIEPLHDLIRALGLPLICVEGVEADDVMGTLAARAHLIGMPTLISTGDKDMAQLVNDHIILIDTMKDALMDSVGVKEKFGVPPERIVDYLTLVGDTSDNIPGVPKVGPKTAVKWLTEFGDLDSLVKNAASVGGAVGENLRQSLQQIPISKQLATIKLDVELPMAPTDLISATPDYLKLRHFYSELGFKQWLNELPAPGAEPMLAASQAEAETLLPPPVVNEPVTARYETVTTWAQLDSWINRLEAAPYFSFDTETTDLNPMRAQLVGLSFAICPGEAAYVPVAHDYPGAPEQLSRDEVLATLKPLLEDSSRTKVGQNLKYDINVLKKYGINLCGVGFDTMLESYVLNSVGTRHNMDDLAKRFLDYETVHFEDIAGKGVKQLTFNQIEIEKASFYAAEDADITLRLHHAIWPQVEADAPLKKVFENIELPLMPILAKIEYTGTLVDAQKLKLQSQQLGRRMLELEKEAHDLAGEVFNLGSPKQLGDILFEKLKLPVVKKTPTGQPSTAENVLEELALNYPLPKVILEYRSLSKLKSTYTDKLPEQIERSTGRIHTCYQQAVAATGRLSSSDPNLQNIPVRTEEGRRIRQAFIAPSGCKIMSADYSQIELRIMAHLSDDAGLLNAFAMGADIHRATAAEVFGVPLESVSSDMRRNAKAINFGLIYGMSAFGLANQLGIGRKEAQKYIDLYFHRYPGVLQYMDDTRRQAAERGYVETLFGRRLYLPDIRSKNPMTRQAAERTAINAPMQGTAADIIKIAMIKLDAWLAEQGVQSRMIMQVHDELVLEVPESEVALLHAQLPQIMASAAQLKVPLLVEVGVGENWDQAH